MFMFKEQPDQKLTWYLQEFLKDPSWVNAMQVMPFLVWLSDKSPADSIRMIQDQGLPERCSDHIVWSLQRWSAFRNGKGTHEAMKKRTKDALPGFIHAMSLAFAELEHHRLSDFDEDEILAIAGKCDHLFPAFGKQVKEKESCVLPSKLAHFIYPSIIPAYDIAEVEKKVLQGLLRVKKKSIEKSYGAYLRLSHWILKQFKEEGSLKEAGEILFAHLHGVWGVRVLAPDLRPEPILPYLDSIIAEYTLLQLAKDGTKVVFR